MREGRERDCDLDPDLMEQALHGLLVNAVEASPEGGVVTMTMGAGSSDGATVLHIEDQGPGMSFDPRPTNLTPGPSTKPWGTGLGIPFAFKVIHAHGGDLAFAPADGGGTRVTVTLPDGGDAGPGVQAAPRG